MPSRVPTLPLAALDPDRDEARRLLEDELAGGDYQLRESWLVRLWTWFVDLLPDVSLAGQLPSWTPWAVLVLVLTVAAAVLAFATRDRWRTGRLRERSPGRSVLDGVRRSAEEYRAEARAALARGEHGTATLEAYRAVTAGAVERTLLQDRPGLTAHEVALALGPVFPGYADPLTRAAQAFDTVRYGSGRGDARSAQELIDLDAGLRDTRPELTAAPALAGPFR